mgnify:FL=1
MGDKINCNTTFWSEISKYKIQVPYYQRDYAQGRKDGGRIDNIRKVFVEELYGAIKLSEKKCHLGLVFGSYNEDDKVFVAVDGQQRLTTAFLLHWYVAWRENKLNDYKNMLKNFSWDTRSYSSQFVDLLFKINKSDSVTEALTTNSNYFLVWEKDPTVKGMLAMLEEIENQYPVDECDLCTKLFSTECNIQYDILKLEKDSDGKTYLKMNSRGRSLTTFELFKSKFLDKYMPDFGRKFDEEWVVFMLKISASTGNQFLDPDIPFMNYINEYTYLQLKLKSGFGNSEDYKEFIYAKKKGELTDVPFVSFDKYNRAFEGDCLGFFERSLDWLCQNYDKIKEVDDELRFRDSRFFFDAIIKDNNPNFSHRVKLFSALRYAELTNYAPVDFELYGKWARVFRNLVANTSIDGSSIGRICNAIYKIDNFDIYKYLLNAGELSAFSEEQIKEEIAKAKQIFNGGARDDGKTWEEMIVESEKYAFFRGAVRFLFTDEKGCENWTDFDKKWENAKEYFGNAGVEDRYKVGLTKDLVIQCNKWQEQLYDKQIFNPDASTWKWILTSKAWREPIHRILKGENIIPATECDDENVRKFITPLLSQLPYDEMLRIPEGRFKWYYRLGFYYNKSDAITFDWDNWKRNEIHSTLADEEKIEVPGRIKNTKFFWGWNVSFRYKKYYFQWWRKVNDNQRDIYLMNDDRAGYVEKIGGVEEGSDENRYYCFNVKDNFPNSLIEQLESLVEEYENSKLTENV